MTEIEPRQVNSLEELIHDVSVSLEGVSFLKVAAEVRDDYDGDGEIGEIVPTYGLKLRGEADEIGVRLSTHLELTLGTVDVDAAVTYRAPYPVLIRSDVALAFANEVGIMTLIPYVREAITSLSARVFGEAVLMPIVRRGELAFTDSDRDETEQPTATSPIDDTSEEAS